MTPGLRITLALCIWLVGCPILRADEGIVLSTEGVLQAAWLQQEMDFERRAAPVQEPALSAWLDQVSARLWRQCGSSMPTVRVVVVQNAIPEALTFPDGTIYLSTGLMAATRSEDQLAGVLAHEIIHYIKRHALAAFEQASSPSLRNTISLWREEAELQADREGLTLMSTAGYCPCAPAGLMKIFEEQQRDCGPFCRKGGFARRLAQLERLLQEQAGDASACPAPEDGRLYLSTLSAVLWANARAALQQGLWNEASQSIQDYLKVHPDDARAYWLKGEIAGRRGAPWQAAASSYRRAIELDRLFAPAYRGLGMIHFKAGHYQDARGYFETSLALAPDAAGNDYIEGYLKLCHPQPAGPQKAD